MNKRAQIGSTISWFFAVIAIFLILLIFLVFTATIGVQKSLGQKGVENSEGKVVMDFLSFRGASFLLENPDGDYGNLRNHLVTYRVNQIEPTFLLETFSQKKCYTYYVYADGKELNSDGKEIFTDKQVSPVVLTLVPINQVVVLNGQATTDSLENKFKFAARYICNE